MRIAFYLDADQSPKSALAARRLGLDVTSARELGRGDLRDDEQLAFAAAERRVLVTRNYSDFDFWTARFMENARPHAGVLFVPQGLATDNFGGMAAALARYAMAYPNGMPAYMIDYLPRASSSAASLE